jgi:uncharacterized protein (TIGR02246 family)
MKRLLMLIPLAFLCCLGCQQDGEEATVDVEADIQAIKDIVADTEAAINTSDIDKFMSFCADDVVEIPANEPALIGKEAVRSFIQQLMDESILQEEDIVKTVHISGDLAVAHILWSATVTPKDTQEPSNANGNMIQIFERQAEDAWKRTYTIFSDETLVFPTSVE